MKTFNAILMISRLESGYSTEAMETVDIAAVIRDVFELYEPVAEEKEADLQLALVDSTLIQANRELVAQALANLIDNALKYAGRNGAAPLKITGRLTADAKTVTIDICDNGPGIALEDRERVTERLIRLEESRTMPGSGLGLSLVKAVMKLHRGKLTLNDAEPGLCARLQFPRSTKDTIQ
jgi:signal transduction histidine kinase